MKKNRNDSFENIAKDLECDESEDALDNAFDKLNPNVEKKEEAEENSEE